MYSVNIDAPGKKTLLFHCRVDSTDEIVIRETFKENTYALHEDYFKHTGIFIDIGANIGTVSLLAWVLGATQVHAYEPEPENFTMLLANIENNQAYTIKPYEQAVWSVQQNRLPLIPSSGASTSNEISVEHFDGNLIYVPTITLEQVLAPFEDVDVLKCDTEGAEYEIFHSRAANQKVRHIVMEYHTTTPDKFGALLALLSLTHNIQVFGHYDINGPDGYPSAAGQIVGRRYDSR